MMERKTKFRIIFAFAFLWGSAMLIFQLITKEGASPDMFFEIVALYPLVLVVLIVCYFAIDKFIFEYAWKRSVRVPG